MLSPEELDLMQETHRALERERARLSAIIGGMNVGTWEWNVQTQETVFNERWAEVLGYTLAELAPISLETRTRLTHPDDLAASAALLQRHFAGELEYYACEARMKHRDGHWVWVLDRGQVATWTAEGKPLLMFGTHQDITAQKTTETQLYRRLAFEELLMSTSSDLLRADSGNLDAMFDEVLRRIGSFAHVDRAQLFRYAPSMDTVDNTHEWCAPGVAPRKQVLQAQPTPRVPAWKKFVGSAAAMSIADVQQLPAAWSSERAALEALGIRSVLMLPVVVGDQALGFLRFDSVHEPRAWSAEDQALLRFLADHLGMTLVRVEQHRDLRLATENANRLAHEKDQANRAKTQFLANMSHEIRTPMHAILGFAQMLGLDASLVPRQAEHVQTILRSGRHLMGLLNDILEMSRIESGEAVLRPARFSLRALLDDLETMFRPSAEARGLSLVVDRGSHHLGQVLGDEGKLRQVLVNLLGNAIKFTERGYVTVRVRTEPAAAADVVGQAALRFVAEVCDSGVGIGPEDLGRLFTPFQQGQRGAALGGTGLGLAISRNFVELMGGTLTVTSEPGEGSCFRFAVSLEDVDRGASARAPGRRGALGLAPGTDTVRVLVVDDVTDNRALLGALLKEARFEVLEASSGAQALELAERWSPHAVLMDLRMPGMDGFEAIRRLKATEAGRATPIIAVSASITADDEANALALGVHAYVRKPFLPEAILSELERALGLRYTHSATPIPAREPGPELAAALRALPPSLVEAMRAAIAEGDMAGLAQQLGQVGQVEPRAARPLAALAEQYEYETLDRWLRRGET